jgi:predicted DCC family thiol-disulfide oxidoreductase YuxK
MAPNYPLTVFYDGACRLCIAQVKKFQRKDAGKRMIFVDVSGHDFDAKQFGLEGQPLRKYLHVKDAAGSVARGVDAFSWMWRACGQNVLGMFVGLPVVNQLAKVLYTLVSRFRYRLFGKNENVCGAHCEKET